MMSVLYQSSTLFEAAGLDFTAAATRSLVMRSRLKMLSAVGCRSAATILRLPRNFQCPRAITRSAPPASHGSQGAPVGSAARRGA